MVALIASLIAFLFEEAFHARGLTTLMWIVALVPILLTLLMMFVSGYAYYTMFDRRDNIKLTLNLKNKDVLDAYGVKMTPSDNYEWIVAQVKHKNTGSIQAKIKIGGGASKKEGDKVVVGGEKTQDTSQGLLGNLEGVNFEE